MTEEPLRPPGSGRKRHSAERQRRQEVTCRKQWLHLIRLKILVLLSCLSGGEEEMRGSSLALRETTMASNRATTRDWKNRPGPDGQMDLAAQERKTHPPRFHMTYIVKKKPNRVFVCLFFPKDLLYYPQPQSDFVNPDSSGAASYY